MSSFLWAVFILRPYKEPASGKKDYNIVREKSVYFFNNFQTVNPSMI